MEILSPDARLPQFRTLETTSLQESRAALCREICPHRLIPARDAPLHTLHSRIGFRLSSLHYLCYGAPVRVENGRLAQNYLVLLPCGGSSLLRVGGDEIRVAEDRGAVIAPGSRFEVEGDAGAEALIWRVSAAAIQGMAAEGLATSWNAAFSFPLDAPGGAGFLRVMRFVLSELGCRALGEGANLLRDKLEELLISALLETNLAGHRPRGGPVPACVRRVQKFIDENAGEDLTFDDLVAASGVGARTLSRAFPAFTGLTPMAYLRQVRMQRVRADLLNAGPGDSVTAILTRWGVTQFGRFATEYHRIYGERPSATLRLAQEAV